MGNAHTSPCEAGCHKVNGWNRLNVAARTVPGEYVAGSLAKLHAAS